MTQYNLPNDLVNLAERLAEYISSQLRLVPNQDGIISDGDNNFTIRELIEDLKNLTPRGLDFIRYYLGAKKTLRAIGKSWSDSIEDKDDRLHKALSEIFRHNPQF